MTIQEILNNNEVKIAKLAYQRAYECLDWKPWKASEIAFDNVMCYLEKLPEVVALEDNEGYLADEVLDAIYDFTDNLLAKFAELINMKAEDLGVNC